MKIRASGGNTHKSSILVPFVQSSKLQHVNAWDLQMGEGWNSFQSREISFWIVQLHEREKEWQRIHPRPLPRVQKWEVLSLWLLLPCTVSKRVLILRTWSFLAFWVLIYVSGSLFSLFWFHSRKKCQFSLHLYIFAGIGSGLHCWQILILTYAYA